MNKFTAVFKIKVVIEAIKEKETIQKWRDFTSCKRLRS